MALNSQSGVELRQHGRVTQPLTQQRTTRPLREVHTDKLERVGQYSLNLLCQAHGIALLDLARRSGRDPLIIWDILRGNPVKLVDALMVISGLNSLCGKRYTMKDVMIKLL